MGATPIFDAGSGSVRINTTGALDGLDIYSTQAGIDGVSFITYHVKTNAIDDAIFVQQHWGKDSGGATQIYGMVRCVVVDPDNANETSKFTWDLFLDALQEQTIQRPWTGYWK